MATENLFGKTKKRLFPRELEKEVVEYKFSPDITNICTEKEPINIEGNVARRGDKVRLFTSEESFILFKTLRSIDGKYVSEVCDSFLQIRTEPDECYLGKGEANRKMCGDNRCRLSTFYAFEIRNVL